MYSSQRFTVVAILLSASLGAALALSLRDDTRKGADSGGETVIAVTPRAAKLRPSLAAEPVVPELTTGSLPQIDPHPRFAFVAPEVGGLKLPMEETAALSQPAPWSIEVNRPAQRAANEAAGSAAAAAAGASRSEAKSERAAAVAALKARISKQRRIPYTLKSRLAEISPAALSRLQARFRTAKAHWPPAELTYVGIKDERALEVYSKSASGEWTFVHRYRVLGASGRGGPKLVRGDKQVPEGIYRISYLNPNSSYHVSLRVSFPNSFDRKMAAADGRKDLGGDIMIHGKNLSAGCLAVGDESAEELFVLANEVGLKNVTVVIAPTDLRRNPAPEIANTPAWTPQLYAEIASALKPFKVPEQPGLLSLLGL